MSSIEQGASVSQGILTSSWLWSMRAGLKVFSETDFTEDLNKPAVPIWPERMLHLKRG